MCEISEKSASDFCPHPMIKQKKFREFREFRNSLRIAQWICFWRNSGSLVGIPTKDPEFRNSDHYEGIPEFRQRLGWTPSNRARGSWSGVESWSHMDLDTIRTHHIAQKAVWCVFGLSRSDSKPPLSPWGLAQKSIILWGFRGRNHAIWAWSCFYGDSRRKLVKFWDFRAKSKILGSCAFQKSASLWCFVKTSHKLLDGHYLK